MSQKHLKLVVIIAGVLTLLGLIGYVLSKNINFYKNSDYSNTVTTAAGACTTSCLGSDIKLFCKKSDFSRGAKTCTHLCLGRYSNSCKN